jgi:hypothetical protein
MYSSFQRQRVGSASFRTVPSGAVKRPLSQSTCGTAPRAGWLATCGRGVTPLYQPNVVSASTTQAVIAKFPTQCFACDLVKNNVTSPVSIPAIPKVETTVASQSVTVHSMCILMTREATKHPMQSTTLCRVSRSALEVDVAGADSADEDEGFCPRLCGCSGTRTVRCPSGSMRRLRHRRYSVSSPSGSPTQRSNEPANIKIANTGSMGCCSMAVTSKNPLPYCAFRDADDVVQCTQSDCTLKRLAPRKTNSVYPPRGQAA